MAVATSTNSPLGFFIRAPGAQEPPSPVLADNIDQETRDFASLSTGDDVIDAQVKLALGTVRNSGPSVIEDGLTITSTKIDEQFQSRTESDVRRSLLRLVNNGDIQIIAVTFDSIDEGNQTTQVRIEYRNLRALDGQTRTVPLPLPGIAGV